MYYKKHIDIYELIVYDIWYMILAIIVNYVKVFQNHMKSAGLQKSISKNSAWLFFKDFPFSNAVFCIFFVLDSYSVRTSWIQPVSCPATVFSPWNLLLVPQSNFLKCNTINKWINEVLTVAEFVNTNLLLLFVSWWADTNCIRHCIIQAIWYELAMSATVSVCNMHWAAHERSLRIVPEADIGNI